MLLFFSASQVSAGDIFLFFLTLDFFLEKVPRLGDTKLYSIHAEFQKNQCHNVYNMDLHNSIAQRHGSSKTLISTSSCHHKLYC